MKISIYAKILLRPEVFFLEEWIEHYLMLGVDTFHICIHDSLPASPSSKRGFGGKVKLPKDRRGLVTACGKSFKPWIKKPYLDYFLDYTDKEINDKLKSVVSKFPNVKFSKYTELYRECRPKDKPKNRSQEYRYCVENNDSDWWFRVDPDEYVILRKHDNLIDLINDYSKKGVTCLRFSQKIFAERKRDKLVREIFNWGYAPSSGLKSLIINDIKKYHEHQSEPSHGEALHLPRSVGAVFHYRGHPKKHLVVNKKHHDMNCKFNKIDESMKKYL